MVENKKGALLVLVYMAASLLVTGGGGVDVAVLVAGACVAAALVWVDDLVLAWVHVNRARPVGPWPRRLSGAAFIFVLVLWLAAPWLLWWGRR